MWFRRKKIHPFVGTLCELNTAVVETCRLPVDLEYQAELIELYSSYDNAPIGNDLNERYRLWSFIVDILPETNERQWVVDTTDILNVCIIKRELVVLNA